MNDLVKKHGLAKALAMLEIEALKLVLNLSNSKAAEYLKIPISTYRSKVEKYRLR